MPSLCSMLAQRRSLRAPSDPSGVDQEFRRDEQRQSARSGGRPGQARQHEMDDVFGHVVFAIGDEDLLAEKAIGSVLGPLGPRLHRVEVRSGLRLGQIHRAGPPSGDHLREIGVEQVAGPVRLERADRPLRQQRAERERHRGAVPDFRAGDVDEVGQPHSAEFRRSRDAAPAGFRPAAIDVAESGRHGHDPIFITGARDVARPIERRNFVGGETSRFADDGRNRLPVEISVQIRSDHFGQAGDRLEGKQNIGDRRTVGHSRLLRFARHTPNLATSGRMCLIRQSQTSLCIDEFRRNARQEALMATSRRTTRMAPATPETIAAAAACLRAGGLVAMPTETVYGLAVDATSDAAVAGVFAAKGRPAFNPLIAHVLGLEAAREHAIFGPDAERLALAFWPGPLTLVLPVARGCRVSLLARAGLDTLAVRAPAHPVARSLIDAAEVPLAAPSANRSGRVSPTTAAHVLADLDGRIDWIIDGGPSQPWTRIDDRRLPGHAEAAPSRRDPARSDRGGAGTPSRFAGAARERRRARPDNSPRTMRRAPACASRRRKPSPTKRSLILPARLPAGRRSLGWTFRRRAISPRRRRICSLIFARWTRPEREP